MAYERQSQSPQPLQQPQPRKNNFAGIIKNIFYIVLILQFAPSMIANLRVGLEDMLYPKAQIGYLKIDGLIKDSSFYTKRIEEFGKNPNIKALLLKVESPGGFPASSQAVFNELKKFKKKKPIVALIENMCASGGYYIASAATEIIASPSSLVGSIGAVAQIPSIKGLLDTWNVKFNFVQSGKYKTVGSPMKDMNKEDLDYLQRISDDTYSQFVKDIAISRKLSQKEYKRWADGKIFTGNQAFELKLVDQLGSFSDAIDVIKKLAKIKKEVKLVTLKKRPSGFMRLFAGDEDYGTVEHSSSANFSDKTATFLSTVLGKLMHKQAVEQRSVSLY